MKRVLVPLFIAGYLGILVYGLVCHAFDYRTGRHPAMYFIVWDMYCGWSAYETRQHVLAEGESGRFYDLTDTPWGTLAPYGGHPRQTHDYAGTYAIGMARNALRHTQHEPMVRLFLVDEAWSRKYNLPDDLWPLRHAERKDPLSYFHVRRVTTPEGQIVQENSTWLTLAAQQCVLDNPRLRRDMTSGRQFYAVSPQVSRGEVIPTSYELPVE